ncbi:hypothetical protein BpHYR1_006264 [Brachionus plicatilis]|uniref:Chromo domain-containing protein n=1 Tax=Brachionus plicatilis TaxID=10195 RepID=A0A3M7RUW5_BRAPC|nr:hypothetical protein BpHYR1_006264 [Brachionus plicatilis]
MDTNDQTRKSSSISSRKSIGPAKFVKRDIRQLYRKAFHEYDKIFNIGKKNFQQFKSLMKARGLKFSIEENEQMRNLNVNVSEIVNWNLPDCDLPEFCHENEIELPPFPMDDSIYSKNIIDFDMVSKTFVTEIRDETEEFKSAIDQTQQFTNNHPVQLMETCELIQAKSLIKSSITISKLNDNDSSKVIPDYVHPDDIYFDFDKVLGSRRKEGKKQAKIKWSKIGGKDFKPTWENLSMVNPEFQKERPERPPQEGSGIVHFSDMRDKKKTLKFFEKIRKNN